MKSRIVLFLSLITFAAFGQTIGLQSFATGFSSPVEITHAGDERLFVVERGGKIKIVNQNGVVNNTPFLDLSSSGLIVSGGERGLLGLAFHPAYYTNGYFYINYTRIGDGATVIARYTANPNNPDLADPSSASIILTVPQPYSNHNGGCLRFGPDGFLYIGMGDGGSAGDPGNRAQNINENLGKMLRIDVNSGSPYGIPPSNPYVGIAGNDEIWAIGLRNPWKFSFNRQTGDLWIADVGQNNIEEINKIMNPITPGLNFGWRCYEGNAPYNTAGCAPMNTMTMPFSQYPHSGTGGCSVTGGYVYTGNTYPSLQNLYLFADYCNNKIGVVDNVGNINWSSAFGGNNFSTLGEDINGELYIAGLSSGTIYKIIDTALSTNEFSKSGLSIYPNPANNSFFIFNSGTNIFTNVQVKDLSGKILMNQKILNNPLNTVDIQNLSSGIYLVTIEDIFGNSQNTKLIINR